MRNELSIVDVDIEDFKGSDLIKRLLQYARFSHTVANLYDGIYHEAEIFKKQTVPSSLFKYNMQMWMLHTDSLAPTDLSLAGAIKGTNFSLSVTWSIYHSQCSSKALHCVTISGFILALLLFFLHF